MSKKLCKHYPKEPSLPREKKKKKTFFGGKVVTRVVDKTAP